MHKAHYPKGNVQRLYIKRKEGGRGRCSGCSSMLHHYVQNSQERLISATWRSLGEQVVTETPKITKQKRQTKIKQDWKNKTPWPVHRRY